MKRNSTSTVSVLLILWASACIDPPPPTHVSDVDAGVDTDDGASVDMGRDGDVREEVACGDAPDPGAGGFQAGRGTERDPYIICGAEQLSLIHDDGGRRVVPEDRVHYELGADIELGSEWTPIRCVTGVLDGAGHEISGLVVDYDFYRRIPDNEKSMMCNKIADIDHVMGGLINELQGELRDVTINELEISMVPESPTVALVGGVIGQVSDSAQVRDVSLIDMKATFLRTSGGFAQHLKGGSVDGLYIYGSNNAPVQLSGSLGGSGVAFARIGRADSSTMIKNIVIYNAKLNSTQESNERSIGVFAGEIKSGDVNLERVFVSSELEGSVPVYGVGGLVGRVTDEGGRGTTLRCEECAVEFSNNHYSGSIGRAGGVIGVFHDAASVKMLTGYVDGELVAELKAGALVGEQTGTSSGADIDASDFSVRSEVSQPGEAGKSCVVGGGEVRYDADDNAEFIHGECSSGSSSIDYDRSPWTGDRGCLVVLEDKLEALGLQPACSN